MTSYLTSNNRYNTHNRAIYVSYMFTISNNVRIHVYVYNVYETFHPMNVNSTNGCFGNVTTETALYGLKFCLSSLSEEESNFTYKKNDIKSILTVVFNNVRREGYAWNMSHVFGVFSACFDWSNSSIGPYMASARLISSTVTGQFKM